MMKCIAQKILFATTIAASLSVLTTNFALAWGPERATFTMESPATYPTFNSITDNPTIGDERDFVRIGEIGADVTDLTNEITVIPGHQYLVYIYFHNNASSTFNDAAHNHSGVALRTRMASTFSTVLTPSEKGTVSATITADNANPGSVWDEAYMVTSADKVLMHYVAGSAHIYNDWKTNNSVLSPNLFSETGTLLGLNALNGVIPGCEEYHGVVTYALQAEELGGSIIKTVSSNGTTFNKSTNIAPSEEVTFQLTITNTGDTPLTNTTIRDTLPEGLTLVPGSVQLRANESTTWDPLPDNIIDTGYHLGTIGTGNTVYITYRAIAEVNYDCSGSGLGLTNSAVLTYDSESSSGDSREDSAMVVVTKTDCEVPDIPLDTCETNPSLEGCKQVAPPAPEKTCVTNPEMPGCQELPNTGPLEIILATIIIIGIGGGGYYLYRTHKVLKAVENSVSGKDTAGSRNNHINTDISDSSSSQTPHDMV